MKILKKIIGDFDEQARNLLLKFNLPDSLSFEGNIHCSRII